MNNADQLPTIAVSMTAHVSDFEGWKRAFEGNADLRRQAGILGHHISRGSEDGNLVCVFLAATDRARLEEFLAGEGLKARQRAAGVAEAPSVALLVPQEDRAVRGRPLAAAMLSFDVEDYDRWKAMFDTGRELRQRAGVVGYAISRSAANPNQVVVYLQAESTEQLRAHVTSSEVKAGQQKAGVSGAPRITFLQDPGSWTRYAG